MRATLAIGLLLPLTAALLGCPPSDLVGECVPGIDYADEPQIVPSESPFIMCPISPTPPYNKKYGNFLVNNCGRQLLTIESSDIVTNDDSGVFTDMQIPESEVQPGESTAARFTYTAIDTEEHRGKITIVSNAENFPTFEMDVVVRSDEPFDGGFCEPVNGSEDAG